ncbi:type IV pilin protein [Rhodoferax sp.]|uniref:type IV pilin protein n=1 Tax=Rhodoferax sp. TaxID=50421 RepID=UPI00275A5AD3|nr:type IV pilin protein [Rhodoferax sp.]
MNQTAQRAVSNRGFTLIEVMITIAIVAILTAVALPSYNEYVLRSHRSNARTALVGAVQWMERAATVTGVYPLTAAVPAGLLVVEGARYTLTVNSPDGLVFTFTATPAAGTPQVGDKCGNLVIDQTGLKTVTAATLTAMECWAR